MDGKYPHRGSHHAHRITRLLFKSCAAQHLGPDAMLLIIHIAHTEDAARYQSPVRFWNSQLNETLGFKHPRKINIARAAAIEAGWLHYERDHDRAVGLYWTLIPPQVLKFDDRPIEDSHSTGGTGETFYSTGGTGSGTGSGTPSNPIPKPNPKEKRPRFKPPTVEDVRAYCLERSNRVNPDQFVDHYQANGWTQGKGKPIRDWQAAVRTWERNGLARESRQDQPRKQLTPIQARGAK